MPSARRKALFDVHLDLLLAAQVPVSHGGTIALGDKAIGDVLKADIEAVREGRRALLKNRPLAKGGECGINRLLSRAQHLFAWAVAEGYASDTPFKRNGVTVIKLALPRSREHHDDVDLSGEHAGAAGARAGSPRSRTSTAIDTDFRDGCAHYAHTGRTRLVRPRNAIACNSLKINGAEAGTRARSRRAQRAAACLGTR
jgi:hypothetical protein